ncbi:hypothetical protein PFISCL1PPCAC_2286, partial [Pristionchus fissidentatus]
RLSMIGVSSTREESAIVYPSPHSIPRGQAFVSLNTLGRNVLTIAVTNKCRVRDILRVGCTECRIAQEKLFGVAMRVPSEGVGCDSPRNEYLFLDPDQFLHKFIGKQSRLPFGGRKGGETKRLVLYLRVATYVSDTRIITCTRTKEEYYTQLRENLIDQWAGKYSVSQERCWEMAVLALRADKGDNVGGYFKAENYFPLWLIEHYGHDFIKKAMNAALQDLSHLSKSDAMESFCQEATRPPYALNTHVYGMRRHKCDTVDRALFTISPVGVSIYAVGEEGDKVLLKNLQWNKISRLSFNRRKISITSLDSTTMSLFAQNEAKTRYLLSLCRTVHQTLLGFNIHRFPRICEEEKSIDEAISASTSGVVSECDRREVIEEIEEEVEEEERKSDLSSERGDKGSMTMSRTLTLSTPPPLEMPPPPSHSPPSPTSSSSSSSSPLHYNTSIVPPPSYPIYTLPGPSTVPLPISVSSPHPTTVYPESFHSGVYFSSGYVNLPSNESIASEGSTRDGMGIGMDSKTHTISLSLHDFHLNSVANTRGNQSIRFSNTPSTSSMGGPRLSSNSESRIDSLDGVTHSDLRSIYSPQLQSSSTSSHLISSIRPSTSISRVQSMPAHQSITQSIFSSPISISSHRDPPPYDRVTQALQRAHYSLAETGETQAAYPQSSVLSSSVPSVPSTQPINSLTIEELRRFPLMENIFREFNPFTDVTRLTRYEPHEALLSVPHNDLPRPSPQLSSDSFSESLYAMPPPPPYPINSSLVK